MSNDLKVTLKDGTTKLFREDRAEKAYHCFSVDHGVLLIRWKWLDVLEAYPATIAAFAPDEWKSVAYV